MPRLFPVVAAVAAVAGQPVLAAPLQTSPSALSTLLQRQTEAFAAASQSGDKAALAKYLDPEVVFTNETGATATRQEIIDEASPNSTPPKSVITDWRLRPQGEVATATFTDVVTRDIFGHTVETRYRSTEVWVRRGDGWKMVASDTAYVPRDPPALLLGAAQLKEYVGLYELAPGFRVAITRDGDGLASSTNGAQATPLAFEVRDVAFTAGGGNGRRLFVRGASGRVEGFISSRDGTDLRFNRVG